MMFYLVDERTWICGYLYWDFEDQSIREGTRKSLYLFNKIFSINFIQIIIVRWIHRTEKRREEEKSPRKKHFFDSGAEGQGKKRKRY